MANFSKPTAPRFSVDVYQNEFLPEGGRDVSAIVTVTSTGGGTSGGHAGHAGAAGVVIMVDCSGSMDYPATKMRGAREATAAAVDTLRDGTHFALVAGTHVAKEVYPGNGGLAVADARTRAEAKEALRRALRGRRHGDRHLAAPRGPAALLRRAHDPARHPAHRRPQRARVAGGAAGRARRLRGPVHL
ncbi:hypothetical protein STANM309S_01965 [Streptomyces tanashiensis]